MSVDPAFSEPIEAIRPHVVPRRRGNDWQETRRQIEGLLREDPEIEDAMVEEILITIERYRGGAGDE